MANRYKTTQVALYTPTILHVQHEVPLPEGRGEDSEGWVLVSTAVNDRHIFYTWRLEEKIHRAG